MATRTRTPLERERDLAALATLYFRGMPQYLCAERLGVSRQQVGYDLAVLRKRWQASALADFGARLAQELARLDHLEAVAWQAWERSCRDEEAAHEACEGGRTRSRKTVRGRSGNPAFLEQISRCIEARLRVMGAFKQVNVSNTMNGVVINWDEMTDPQPVEDKVEARITEIGNRGNCLPGTAENGGGGRPGAGRHGGHL
jgi:hypothetical protein